MDKPEPLSNTLRPWTFAYRYANPLDGGPVWRVSGGGEWNGQQPQEARGLCWIDDANELIGRHEARIAELERARDDRRDEFTSLTRALHTANCDIELLRGKVDNNVWAWQADETDHLESMSKRMSVLIFAGDLRALLSISRAEAERERDELVQKMYQLESERDALRADAERYQWLRGRDLNTIAAGGVFAGMTPQNIVINGADLDSRIDAERAAEGNPNA